MLLIVCLTVCGVAFPGRQRRELPGFPGLNFDTNCPALDALAVAGSVGEFGFNHESVMRSFNPMGDLWPLRDFRFYQDR